MFRKRFWWELDIIYVKISKSSWNLSNAIAGVVSLHSAIILMLIHISRIWFYAIVFLNDFWQNLSWRVLRTLHASHGCCKFYSFYAEPISSQAKNRNAVCLEIHEDQEETHSTRPTSNTKFAELALRVFPAETRCCEALSSRVGNGMP